MRAQQLIATLLAVLLAGSMVVPAAAGSDASTAESIELTLEVNEEWTAVTVEHAGSAEADANLTIDAIGSADARAEGEYQSNAEGTVKIPTPDSEQTVEFDVESDNVSATGAVTLQAHHGLDYTYTIALDADAEASAGGSVKGESSPDDDGDDDQSDDGGLTLVTEATGDADLRVTAGQGDRALITAGFDIEADAGVTGETGADDGSGDHGDSDTDDGDDDADGDDGSTVGVGL